MDVSWLDAQTFLAVAEEGSFTAAARALGIGQPTVSRRIAEMEERAGCSLFRRGKLGAELTEHGERLVGAAEQMARWAGEFGRLARGAESEAEGIVRIAAPPGFSVEFLAPFAAWARERVPEIRLEVLSAIEHVDLARGVADLAVRTQAPNDPALASLGALRFPLGVFASPAYVDALPARAGLADLAWVTWAGSRAHLPPRPWLEERIPGFTPVFASDDYLVQKGAVVAGLGAMVLERASLALSRAPVLAEIDVGLRLPEGEWHLVCATAMRFVPRVRRVADLLIAQLRDARLD